MPDTRRSQMPPCRSGGDSRQTGLKAVQRQFSEWRRTSPRPHCRKTAASDSSHCYEPKTVRTPIPYRSEINCSAANSQSVNGRNSTATPQSGECLQHTPLSPFTSHRNRSSNRHVAKYLFATRHVFPKSRDPFSVLLRLHR